MSAVSCDLAGTVIRLTPGFACVNRRSTLVDTATPPKPLTLNLYLAPTPNELKRGLLLLKRHKAGIGLTFHQL
jgi:hypothetical protein